MAHRKKRQDTTTIVYKFWAMPIGELPQSFWASAKEVRNIWNELVEMREQLWEKIKDLEKKERIPHYKEFEERWRNYLKSEAVKDRLGNDEREYLIEKFDRADKEAKKGKGNLRKQFALDRVFFRHRYSGGGKSLSEFKRQHSKGFTFHFPHTDVYNSNCMEERRKRIGRGSFGLVKDRKDVFSFPFSAIIHREIIENAIVKSVAWVGKRTKNSGLKKKHLPESQRDWQWSIVITVEIPQYEEHKSQQGRVIALDVGWRQLSNSLLRIGAMQDTDGNLFEVCCPIAYESCNVEYGRLAASLYEVFDLDEQIGDLIQMTKNKLSELGFKNLVKMRQGGLFRLQSALLKEKGNSYRDDKDKEETTRKIDFHAKGVSDSDKQAAIELLENFKNEYMPLSSKRVRSFARLSNYRDWLYQNIAAWLAENYDALILEGDLSLKRLAEQRKDLNKVETQIEKDAEKRRRFAAKHRQFASLYKFRDYIQKAFDKKGKEVIDGIAAYTSRKCAECGEIVPKSVEVELVCSKGHNFDRDFNATKNLLSQLEDKFVFVKGNPLEIPNKSHRDLSRVLRKVTLRAVVER